MNSFTCPECERTSWHPEDVRYGYCGACHEFTGSRPPAPTGSYGVPVDWPVIMEELA